MLLTDLDELSPEQFRVFVNRLAAGLEERGYIFNPKPNMERIGAATEKVRAWIDGSGHASGRQIEFAMILGSGLGSLLSSFSVRAVLPYTDIPNLGRSGAPGHASTLFLVELRNKLGLIFSGRRHWYEGQGWTPPAIPPAIARALGAKLWITTTACGGVREDVRKPGTIVLVDDFVHRFPFDPVFGTAPQDFGGAKFWHRQIFRQPENAALRDMFAKHAERAGKAAPSVCYAAEPGPDYEPLNVVANMVRDGVGVVGMSGVESIYAARGEGGLKVLHIGLVTNTAAGLTVPGSAETSVPNEGEVVDEAARMAAPLGAILVGFLQETLSS